MAVIEITPKGEICKANSLFLDTMGYSMEQIIGKHHSLFCTQTFLDANPNFWQHL